MFNKSIRKQLLQAHVEHLEKENEALKAEISNLKLVISFDNPDEQYEELRKLIASLQESKAIYDSGLAELKTVKDNYDKLYKDLQKVKVDYAQKMKQVISDIKHR